MPFTFNLLNTRVSNSKSAPNTTSDSLFQFQIGGKKIVQNTIENSNSNKSSTPKLYKKIGSSKTHYDGTGSRLLKLKAAARK